MCRHFNYIPILQMLRIGTKKLSNFSKVTLLSGNTDKNGPRSLGSRIHASKHGSTAQRKIIKSSAMGEPSGPSTMTRIKHMGGWGLEV